MVVFAFMEVWKKNDGFENYEVSNFGNVRGLPIKANFGCSYKIYPLRHIKQWNDKKGYCYVSLVNNNKKKNFLVHRLVAIAFIPNIENKPQVNHINGIKTDNRVENLEWNTAKENICHAINNGLNLKHGIYNYQSKLSLKDIEYILNSNLTQKELSIKFNISQSGISRIVLNKTYKNVRKSNTI